MQLCNLGLCKQQPSFLCVHYYPVFPHMFKGFVYHSRLLVTFTFNHIHHHRRLQIGICCFALVQSVQLGQHMLAFIISTTKALVCPIVLLHFCIGITTYTLWIMQQHPIRILCIHHVVTQQEAELSRELVFTTHYGHIVQCNLFILRRLYGNCRQQFALYRVQVLSMVHRVVSTNTKTA